MSFKDMLIKRAFTHSIKKGPPKEQPFEIRMIASLTLGELEGMINHMISYS